MRRLARRAAAAPGPLPRPDRPAGTDLLPQIGHIVVVMMENHFYDNYLGMLQGRGEGFPLGPDGEPQVFSRGTGGEVIRAFHLASTVQRRGVPSQSWHASHLQWGERRCDGFVTSAQDVQVPAVIVSLYARPDYVCSRALDHTSVLRLVEEKWNLPARDAAANTPLDALDFTNEPAFGKPPLLPEPSLEWGTW